MAQYPKNPVKDADNFVDALAKKEKKDKFKKGLGKAVKSFKAGASKATKTDLSGAKAAYREAAQSVLARKKKRVY